MSRVKNNISQYSDKKCAQTVFTGELFSFLSVDLFQHSDGLFVSLLYLVSSDVFIVKFSDMYVVKALTSAEGVLLDVLGLVAYTELHEVLAAVERPTANSLYGIWNVDSSQ